MDPSTQAHIAKLFELETVVWKAISDETLMELMPAVLSQTVSIEYSPYMPVTLIHISAETNL